MNRPTVAVYAIPEVYPKGNIAFAHDHAIAIMIDGKVEKYLHLERFTRVKRDNSLQHNLSDILKELGLLKGDFDFISVDSVQGRSFITSDGKIRVEAGLTNQLSHKADKAWCWFLDKPKEAFVLSHELAHIYSSVPFWGAFNENSLLVHFDGGASRSNFSAWHFQNGSVKHIESNWNLKYLSSLFNANALVFNIIGAKFPDQHSVPGKFMGYASYGNYSADIEAFLLKNDFFKNIWAKPTVFFKALKNTFGYDLKSFDQHDVFLKDIAATIHEYWVRKLVVEIERLKQLTGADYLYYSGGSALNIVANTRLLKTGWFKNIYIPPCTDDSGLVVGAAAFLEQQKGNLVKMHSPYLNNYGINYEVLINKNELEKTANLLAKGAVVGVCNGSGECGPRALGNRSIIARADSKALAAKVSCDMKQREWYRPVAPIMLAVNVPYYTGQQPNELTKYMLLDLDVLPEKQAEIEGVVHVDGTARVQAIFDEGDNPWIFQLLQQLEKTHQIKTLINTSFNSRGEPMVQTKSDAINAAKKMRLDALVFNGILIELND